MVVTQQKLAILVYRLISQINLSIPIIIHMENAGRTSSTLLYTPWPYLGIAINRQTFLLAI